MTEVKESCELGAPAAEVWSLVADFAGFAEMLVASFVPTGDTENEAAEAIRAVYREGIALMQGHFGE